MLLPVIAAQGIWVRFKTPVLAEASGPVNGTAGRTGGGGTPMRLGVLGDSTAAGCGVGTHGDGFTGRLAHEIATRTGRAVAWEVVGQLGATSRRVRYRLLPQFGTSLDLAVLLVGVNDVLSRRKPEQWRDDLTAIVDELADRAEHVVVTGIPPFEAFPSLPTALARYLARHASALDDVAQRTCALHPRATWISSAAIQPLGPEFFARDGFHPSAAGYRRWAQIVADHLRSKAFKLEEPH